MSSPIILLLKTHVDGYTRQDGTYVKPHQRAGQAAPRGAAPGQLALFPAKRDKPKREVFYHGTATGNTFDKFDPRHANTGVSGNAIDQGDVTYLTSSKTAAKYFSVKANQNKALRTKDMEAIKGAKKEVGTIAHVELDSDARVKHLDHRPSSDEVKKLAHQGYDAVRFKETAFNHLEENPLGLVEEHLKEGGSDTLAVINHRKVRVVKHEHPPKA